MVLLTNNMKLMTWFLTAFHSSNTILEYQNLDSQINSRKAKRGEHPFCAFEIHFKKLF